jgi:hypothetical protein
MKLVERFVRTDFATDKAFSAARTALLVQFANLEFFLAFDVRFFGTAMTLIKLKQIINNSLDTEKYKTINL